MRSVLGEPVGKASDEEVGVQLPCPVLYRGSGRGPGADVARLLDAAPVRP